MENDSTVVNVMRHGEVFNPTGVLYGRAKGYFLSDKGKAQAAETANFLQDKNIVYLLSSPLERAQETIKIASKGFNLPVHTDELLLESENTFQGEKIDLQKLITTPKYWSKLVNPFKPSWGEPYQHIAVRMLTAVKRAEQQAKGAEALCVSHQLPIYTLRRKIVGEHLWHDPRNRECDLASVTRIHFQNNEIQKLTYWTAGMDDEKLVWQK